MSHDQSPKCLSQSGSSAQTISCMPKMPICASRSNQAGWKNYYLGSVSVMHHGGRSSDKKPESNFASIMMRESLLEFMRLRRGPIYAVAYQFTIVVIAVLRLLLLMVAFVFTLGGRRRKTAPPGICQVGQGTAMGPSHGSVVQTGSLDASKKIRTTYVWNCRKSRSQSQCRRS